MIRVQETRSVPQSEPRSVLRSGSKAASDPNKRRTVTKGAREVDTKLEFSPRIYPEPSLSLSISLSTDMMTEEWRSEWSDEPARAGLCIRLSSDLRNISTARDCCLSSALRSISSPGSSIPVIAYVANWSYKKGRSADSTSFLGRTVVRTGVHFVFLGP
ncbi:hypothetical protein BS47DRAFT_1392646 [Hydnum rufescens UP504]|uniref:Uncharacterized protein n=1 Tax=Hydnum rufescens UP504 TaxID=1448309 RepID=A0A9P6AYT6_9AGAM|nr:hypothetical protein BS47DRAFT_1392646 [Hydnum rufescens UP504]